MLEPVSFLFNTYYNCSLVAMSLVIFIVVVIIVVVVRLVAISNAASKFFFFSISAILFVFAFVIYLVVALLLLWHTTHRSRRQLYFVVTPSICDAHTHAQTHTSRMRVNTYEFNHLTIMVAFFFSFCCCYKTRYCSLRFCSGSSAKRSWHYGNSACPLQSAAHRCGGPSVRRSSCFFRKVVFSFVLFSVLLPFYESTNWEIQYTCIHMSNV